MSKIPLVDLAWQAEQVKDDVEHGWAEVMRGTSFIGGPAVGEFEKAFAAFLGGPEVVGVANGTDALEIALRAAGVRAGDAVALPANTFVATAFAVLRMGALPRLVDVDEGSLLMDPDRLADTDFAAVVPVHLYGQIAPMDPILSIAGKRPVVEDAAQSQGATQHGQAMGSWGTATATSFYPGKNLGAYGDAGAVLSGDPDIAARMRRMANHGSAVRYHHEEFGFNSRLDTLQAVVLAAKLRRLAEWNDLRRQAALRYGTLLADLPQVRTLDTVDGNVHAWHLYPVRVPHRDAVLTALQAAGIGAAIHYPVPVHQQEALAFLAHQPGDFPVAEAAAASQLSLPLYPGITAEQQEYVVTVLRLALG